MEVMNTFMTWMVVMVIVSCMYLITKFIWLYALNLSCIKCPHHGASTTDVDIVLKREKQARGEKGK